MTNYVWVVTFHFGRGHSETKTYFKKQEAQEAIRVIVFSNEDCINCSIYRQEVMKSSIEQKLDDIKYMLELKDRILNKM
jgi:hypothetical protein